MQHVLQSILEEELGLTGLHREDIRVNVLGINHFTWFDSASYQGIDLFPIYKAYIDKHYEEGLSSSLSNWSNDSFSCTHRVAFDLFRRFGLIAAAGDRHLAEFMPCTDYLKDPDTVKSWCFGLTHVDWRKNDLQKRLEKSQKLLNNEEQVELKPTGEEGILLIKALCGLERVVSNVNIPNSTLQIPNLPASAVVETNALFERDSIRPIQAGNLPENIRQLILPHVENHERILKAALTQDAALVEDAFLADPLLSGKPCTKEQIHELVADMIQGTAAYLPDWKL